MSDDDLYPGEGTETGAETPPVRNPADLAELKATDALLDRLAAGGLSARDRQDPLVAAFAKLRHTLDEPSEDAGTDVARLIEVLGERPLFLLDTGEAADVSLADQPITLSIPVAADETERSVVDVRDGAPGLDDERATGTAGAGQVAATASDAGDGADVRSIFSGTRRGSHGREDDESIPAWQRVMSQVALPAASVIALLALGSGVSAAVTGNPMAPVSGVSKVVQQLPGIGSQPDARQVQDSLNEAGRLATKGQPTAAQKLFKAATDNIGDLPSSVQPSLKANADQIGKTIASASAAAAATPSASPSASAPVTIPSADPQPPVSATPTVPSSSAASPAPSSAAPTPSAATVSPSVGAATVSVP